MIELQINELIVYGIAFLGLLIGSYTDIRTREVPDWLNYGLIGTGLCLNLLFSAIYWKWQYFAYSIIGFGIFFAIAWIMFYTGQWGGGDSKILMGLGALIGVDFLSKNFHFMLGFLVNSLLVGAVYGLLWSFFSVFRNKKKFVKEFKKVLSDKKVLEAKRWILILFLVLVISIIFIKQQPARIMLVYLSMMVIVVFYIWIFIKAVENACMIKLVNPKELTEGDWIAKEIKVNGKHIAGPKDLGVEKKQIRMLVKLYKEKKIKKILMKIGVPFVPSFFVSFIITLAYGNLVFLFI